MVGTTIEWYDFFVYGTSVVLVLGPLFFPAGNPWTSSLLAFSTLGVGFLVRPLGAVVISHFGDRVGRRHALVLSVLLMGGATTAVGVLPTYAEAGAWAPVLLVSLRCIQGFAVGGEWAGAVLLAVEHAPPGRRGRYGAFPQYGTPLGLLASSVAILMAEAMPPNEFHAWGWRVPFLASLMLVAIGLWLRVRVSDAEEFLAVRRSGTTVRSPVGHVLRRHWRSCLAGTAVTFVCHAAYIMTSFLPAYASTVLDVPDEAALVSLVVGSVASVAALGVVAISVDGRDRRWFALGGGLLSTIWAFPAFILSEIAGGPGLVIGVTIALAVGALQYAVIPALLADLFPAPVRYSGVSLCFQISAVLGGGVVPLAAASLVKATGGSFVPAAAMMAAAGLVTAVGAVAVPKPQSAMTPSARSQASS